MDEGSSWLSAFIILVLFFGSAYFAAVESAFASVGRIKLKTAQDRGDRRAIRALKVLDNFDRAITTILIGTNILHIAISTMVTVLVTRLMGITFVAAATIVTTLLVFFFGEMLPKSLAKRYNESFSLACANSLWFFMRLFAPAARLLTAIGAAVAKGTKGDTSVTVTEDELYDIIENMKSDGELEPEKGELVHSALVFADVTVESILTARVDVKALDIDTPQEAVLRFIKEQRHSRLPVYRDSIDNIVGVLQIRKYIKAYLRGENTQLSELLDEAYFVHQSANIDELLSTMSHKKLNMAVVTDNYGGTLGIVTVEDILEELVGEIWDEDDDVEEPFVKLPDGSFDIDPETDIEEVFEWIGFEDPEDTEWNHKLFGEWVYEQFDRLPRQGDAYTYHGVTVTVMGMRQHRLVKLNVRVAPHEEEKGGEDE